MKLRTLKQIKNLKNKLVLLRVDFNVPVKNGRIVSDERIRLSLPTIEYLLKKKAKVILLTHLGRPVGYNGKEKSGYDYKFTLRPIVKRAVELLKRPIKFIEDQKIGRINDQEIYFANVKNEIDKMKSGEIVILENMRFFPEEAKEITELSKKIAGLGDLFVYDGFAVAHRAAASISGVAKYLPSFAGFLCEKEIIGLNKIMIKPKKPFVLILGGVKMETKIPVLKALLPKADHVLIGGGMVSTYLWAKGYKVGKSVIDKDYKKEAMKYLGNKKVVMPLDVVAGDEKGLKIEVLKINSKFKIQNLKLGIYDIGPETIRLYAKYIKKAQTIVWNGPMGFFTIKPYRIGSLSIARLVASRSKGKAFGVIGGGETLQVMDLTKMGEYVDLISTGGGAMLEFLAGNKLPGLKYLTTM